MQYTHNVTMQPQLLGLMLRKDFWSKYKSIIVKEMFPSPMDKFYASVAVFHEKFNEDLDKNKLWEVLKMDNPTLTAAQKGDLYELVESIKEVEEWTPEFAETVLTQIWKQEVWRQVTEVGVKGLEGQMATLEPLSEIYRKHAERFIPQDSFVECAMGIDELLAADADTPKWNFALKPLQEKVGGMAEGQFMQLMARPDCYRGEVEVLTPRGWVRLDKYERGPVAQVDSNCKLTFSEPSAVIKREFTGSLYNFSTKLGRLDVSVTPKHDMVLSHKGNLYKQKAENLLAFPKSAYFETAAEVDAPVNANFSLSPLEALLVAFQADGTMPKLENTGERCGARTIRFSFHKQRKQERLVEILKACGFEYYVDGGRGGKGRNGATTYYVKWPLAAELQPNKTFSWVDLAGVTSLWCEEFIEEVSYWDATRRTNARYKYDTTVKYNADIVQAVAVMAGYAVKNRRFQDNRKEQFSDVFSLTIRKKYKPLSGQTIKVSLEEYSGPVYCVTVPSGMLLVRSNGQTLVCGNCGKTAFLTTLVCGPDGYANQGALVDWYGNEEPIRRTRWRCMSAFTGKTKEELIANKPLARDLWNSIAPNVRTFDVPFGTPVEHIMARTKARRPNIVIVDQLDKLGVTSLTGGFAGETERIRLLYIKFREIAKQCNCLVIGVCQASADAEGQRIVTYDMAENSKTGKAAECDLFLGIGRSPLKEGMLEEDYTRWITVSKNKLDKSWKGVLTCRLEPTVSRYVE